MARTTRKNQASWPHHLLPSSAYANRLHALAYSLLSLCGTHLLRAHAALRNSRRNMERACAARLHCIHTLSPWHEHTYPACRSLHSFLALFRLLVRGSNMGACSLSQHTRLPPRTLRKPHDSRTTHCLPVATSHFSGLTPHAQPSHTALRSGSCHRHTHASLPYVASPYTFLRAYIPVPFHVTNATPCLAALRTLLRFCRYHRAPVVQPLPSFYLPALMDIFRYTAEHNVCWDYLECRARSGARDAEWTYYY